MDAEAKGDINASELGENTDTQQQCCSWRIELSLTLDC